MRIGLKISSLMKMITETFFELRGTKISLQKVLHEVCKNRYNLLVKVNLNIDFFLSR